jgi:glutathione S-transferase
MKLLVGPLSMFSVKTLVAAAEKGLQLEVEDVPYDIRQPRPYLGHPEVNRINPKRQVPVLIDQDLEIFDSTLIGEYLEDLYPEPPLWPGEPRSRARARLVELKADEVWFPKVLALRPVMRQAGPDADAVRAEAVAAFREMEAVLGDRTWMAGAFGYADIAAYVVLLTAQLLGLSSPDELVRLRAWRDRMEARPSVHRARERVFRYLASQRLPVPEPA